MDFLYKDRSKEDFELIQEVCHYMLNHMVDNTKPINNQWGAVYVEGRDRKVTDFESFCAVKSFKLFSKYNAPVYLFLHNDKHLVFQEYGLMEKWNIKVIKIPLLDSLEKYSEFCIKELYYLLPEELKHVITIQPDAMVIRAGFEDWLIDNNFDLIGAKWMHQTGLGALDSNGDSWAFKYPPVSGCNLGFSFRNVSKMREISNIFSKYKLAQWGDKNCPEDAFFSYFGFGEKICKLPTREEMDLFSVDPLDREAFLSKKSFGFHFFKKNA